jgi:hypothetical protein
VRFGGASKSLSLFIDLGKITPSSKLDTRLAFHADHKSTLNASNANANDPINTTAKKKISMFVEDLEVAA